jgi:chromosome segregation ATPase
MVASGVTQRADPSAGVAAGTSLAGAGAGTTPTDAGTATTPPEAGAATTPTNAGTATTPPDAGAATTPSDPGAATIPPDAGTATTPPDPGAATTPPGAGASAPPTYQRSPDLDALAQSLAAATTSVEINLQAASILLHIAEYVDRLGYALKFTVDEICRNLEKRVAALGSDVHRVDREQGGAEGRIEHLEKRVEFVHTEQTRAEDRLMRFGTQLYEMHERQNGEAARLDGFGTQLYEMHERQNGEVARLDGFGTQLYEMHERQNGEAARLDGFGTQLHEVHERQNGEAARLDGFGTQLHEMHERQNGEAARLDGFGTQLHEMHERQIKNEALTNTIRDDQAKTERRVGGLADTVELARIEQARIDTKLDGADKLIEAGTAAQSKQGEDLVQFKLDTQQIKQDLAFTKQGVNERLRHTHEQFRRLEEAIEKRWPEIRAELVGLIEMERKEQRSTLAEIQATILRNQALAAAPDAATSHAKSSRQPRGSGQGS